MDRPVLFINACVRKVSRTRRLAGKLLSKLDKPFEEIRLAEIDFPVSNEEYLGKRDQLTAEGDRQNPLFDLAIMAAAEEALNNGSDK
jgi:FMN-dependent NADH-azoreductase